MSADEEWEIVIDKISCGFYQEVDILAAHCKDTRLWLESAMGEMINIIPLIPETHVPHWNEAINNIRTVLLSKPGDYE